MIAGMDFLRANLFELRQMVEGAPRRPITIVDVLTAFLSILMRKDNDFLQDDDKTLRFIALRARRVPPGVQRQYWLDNLFRLYQTLSSVQNTDPEWVFLQAYLVDLVQRDTQLLHSDYVPSKCVL
jgi:hypothetical protein